MRRGITHPVKAIRPRFTYPYSQSYVQHKRTISLEDTLFFFIKYSRSDCSSHCHSALTVLKLLIDLVLYDAYNIGNNPGFS